MEHWAEERSKGLYATSRVSDDGMIDLMRGDWIERLHRNDVTVVGWNTNELATMTRMVEAGFDVLCTDDPRVWPG